MSPHDIAVSANAREIYVAELASSPANALHKFELVRKKGKNKSKIYFVCFDSFFLYFFRTSN